MLIFDKFGTKEKAERFAIQMRDVCFVSARICASQEESDRYDPFPYKLTPPIVLVLVEEEAKEELIEQAVALFGGRFAEM